MRHGGAAVVVDGDVAALGLYAHVGQPQPLAVWRGADGQDHVAAGGGPAVVAAHGDLGAVTVDADRPCALVEVHAAPQGVGLKGGGHLGVLLGQHLLAAHDEGDLTPERREHVHELDAGDPGADHDEVVGHLVGG